MPNRVLFVDDEPNVLQGLKRMLRSQRNVWDMDFASSGEAALDKFMAEPFDVVVSDMRMPGMDGATLLEWIQNDAPETIRIILSGFSEQDAILRTAGPAHQYLAKPAPAELLVQTITRSLALRERLMSGDAQQILNRLKTIPTAPDTYLRLVKTMKSFSGDLDDITAVIESNPALAAQTMKLTNSAFFRLPESTTSIKRAVQLLGFETLRALALNSELYPYYDGRETHLPQMRILSMRSLQIGQACAAIAKVEALPGPEIDTLLCAGVVSHVGTLALLAGASEQFDNVTQNVDSHESSLLDAEFTEFGCDHAQLGAYFLSLWAFVDPIVEAVAYHHEPHNKGAPPSKFTAILHAAQALVRSQDPNDPNLDMAYLESVGCADRLAAWAAACKTALASPVSLEA